MISSVVLCFIQRVKEWPVANFTSWLGLWYRWLVDWEDEEMVQVTVKAGE